MRFSSFLSVSISEVRAL